MSNPAIDFDEDSEVIDLGVFTYMGIAFFIERENFAEDDETPEIHCSFGKKGLHGRDIVDDLDFVETLERWLDGKLEAIVTLSPRESGAQTNDTGTFTATITKGK